MSAIFDALSEPASERITAGLARIGLAIRSRAWKGAGTAKLTPTQAQVLALLRGRRQGLSLSAVAEALSVTAPTASDAVASLVAKGLLSKSRGADRRAVVLTPTPEGLALADRAAEWPDFVARAVETLAPDEQGAFLRGLIKVIRAMQDAGDIPVQRMCVTCRHFRPYRHDDPVNPHYCAYVDAPFGDRHLRLDCGEQEEAPAEERCAAWDRFAGGPPASP